MEIDGPMNNPVGHDENNDRQRTPDNFGERPSSQLRPTRIPDARPGQAAGEPHPQRRHGYAAVEIHQGAARVIRWEVEEEPQEPSPEQSAQQRRLFRLGEWLSKQPISDQARAEYFDIERVSFAVVQST